MWYVSLSPAQPDSGPPTEGPYNGRSHGFRHLQGKKKERGLLYTASQLGKSPCSNIFLS